MCNRCTVSFGEVSSGDVHKTDTNPNPYPDHKPMPRPNHDGNHSHHIDPNRSHCLKPYTITVIRKSLIIIPIPNPKP